MSSAYEAAAEAAQSLLVEEVPDDEAPVQGEQPEDSAVDAVEAQHEAEPPELPEDLVTYLEEPEFEAEAEAEIEAEAETEDEWVSDAEKELRKQLRAAEKRAEFLETQRLKNDKPRWQDEARKYFPHADIDKIDATSRRGFLKAAKAQHEAVADKVESAVAAKLSGFDAAAEREKIRAEVKAELEAAWGSPTVTTTVAPADAAEHDAAVDKAIQTRGLAAGIREMFNAQQ
jgi:hypothetical protein